MKSVIFIAPPAAGKGTLSNYLENDGYIHYSTGDMLREEVGKKSNIGLVVKDIMEKGLLVPDQVVFELINMRLKNNDKPFILDGFPRSLKQAEMLNELLNSLDINNYEVIYLDIPMEVALERALGRLTCKCGRTYNIYNENLKPMVDGVCDSCGKMLVKRNDDNEDAFKTRFTTFITNNEPIKNYYSNIGKLHILDAKDDNLINKIRDILR